MSRLRILLEAHPRAVVLLLVLVAVAAHLHFVLTAAPSYFRWDSSQYLDGARSMAAGRGFRDAAGAFEARRTPGYPLFLVPFVAFGAGPRLIAAAQHLMAIALVPALFFWLRKRTSSVAVAALGGLLLAVDSGQIFMANYVMTETLMSALLLGIVVLLARVGRTGAVVTACAAGMLVGASVLVRPAAMYLVVPAAVWVAIAAPARRAAVTAAFVACALSLPLAWTWRNAERAGVASLSSIAGEDLYDWRAAGAIAMERSGFEYAPLPFGGEETFRREFFRVAQHELVNASRRERLRAYGAAATNLTEAQVAELDGRLARRILLQHPAGAVFVTINGALHLIFDSTWEYASALYGGLVWIVALDVLFAFSVLSFAFAIIGFRRLRRLDRRLAWLLAVVLLYFVAVLAGPEHEQWRYRVPLVPLYCALIACSALPASGRGSRHGLR